jgi:hypothetical protein
MVSLSFYSVPLVLNEYAMQMLTNFTAPFSRPALCSYSLRKYAPALSSRRSSLLLSTPCLMSTNLSLTLWLSSLSETSLARALERSSVAKFWLHGSAGR